VTVESTAARKPRRSAGSKAGDTGSGRTTRAAGKSAASASTTGTKSAASRSAGAAAKKSPGATGGEPELVQLLTPEGKRVKDATYDPYVADITPDELRGLYRDMVLSRRFDAQLLATLDQAYGLRPETYPWAQLPETFHARLELMARVEHAPALLFGARRLMLQMAGWLMARRSGVTAFTLRWCHDAMRAKSAGDGGELTVRTAQATRDTEHLIRLLAEHLGTELLPLALALD